MLLEGSDIETLLAQVRDEYGSSARIVSADKVRSGGLGGFFAKEKYEISVEIDDGLPGAEPAPGEPSASSVAALLDYADQREELLRLAAAQVANARPGAQPIEQAPARPALAAGYGLAAEPPARPGAAPLPPGTIQPALLPADPPNQAAAGSAFLPLPGAAAGAVPGSPVAAGLPPIAAPLAGAAPEPLLPSTSGADFAGVLAGLRQTIGTPQAPPAASVRPFRPDSEAAAEPYEFPDTAAHRAPPAAAEDAFPDAPALLADTLARAETAPVTGPPGPAPDGWPAADASAYDMPAHLRFAAPPPAYPQPPQPPRAPAWNGHGGVAGSGAGYPPDAAEWDQHGRHTARVTGAELAPAPGDETAYRNAEAAAWARYQAAQEHPTAPGHLPHEYPTAPGHLPHEHPTAPGHAAHENGRPVSGRLDGGAAGPVTNPYGRPAAPAADPAEPPVSGAGPSPLAGELLALGVPASLAARAVGRDPYSAIVRALAMLPAPATAPARAGEILVVTGDLRDAHDIARIAAKRMRIDPAGILVAGPSVAGTGLHASRRMSGPADAEKRAARLRGADTPHVVIIDAPLGGDNGSWAHAVADALGAAAIWAVVDATRKTADVERHLRGLGIVDAIAVHGTQATGDPASVLRLGVPVALLDGRRATPQAWAALLCDRLTELEPGGS